MQTRRDFLAAAAAGASLMLQDTCADASTPAATQRLLIGTSNPSATGGEGKGIYVSQFRGGILSPPVLAVETRSPGFLAMAPHGLLFAEQAPAKQNAQAASYRVGSGADIHALSQAEAGDPGACHVGITKDGSCVFVANYSGGSVASFTAAGDGTLKRASFIQFPPDEHGPSKFQGNAHAHCCTVSPGGGFVLVNDLGLDRIHVFRLNHATAELVPHTPSHWASAAGAGPRHVVVHPNGKWIYSINELDNTVNQLLWHEADGTLTTLATITTLPHPAPEAHACEVIFSKDHRFLYASNRFLEGFAVFSIDAATGALKPVQHPENPGQQSRHIAIDATGKWFLSANQFSGDVSVFPVDTATGKLGPRSSSIAVEGASCLLFA